MMGRFVLPVWTLASREVVRFARQRNRVFGALGQPALFWLLFGTGLNASFQDPYVSNSGFLGYFFPGSLVLIVLFTSIFTSFSIISDRQEGFLQGVLVSPAPRSAMVLGKMLGGAILATFQGLLFLMLAPTVGLSLSPLVFVQTAAVLFLLGFALTGFGFCLAWRMDSIQGFHAIMMVLLLPMWLLSGAFFPAAGAPPLLLWIIRLNPLSYGVSAVRRLLHGAEAIGSAPGAALELPSLAASVGVTCGFALATVVGATIIARQRRTGDRL
jgi:ABC-2 type transport system permease protein